MKAFLVPKNNYPFYSPSRLPTNSAQRQCAKTRTSHLPYRRQLPEMMTICRNIIFSGGLASYPYCHRRRGQPQVVVEATAPRPLRQRFAVPLQAPHGGLVYLKQPLRSFPFFLEPKWAAISVHVKNCRSLALKQKCERACCPTLRWDAPSIVPQPSAAASSQQAHPGSSSKQGAGAKRPSPGNN